MSSDFEGYEQDFAVLTAEITGKIARVPRLPPDEKKQMVANVEKQLEEAKELLEQMDLEVREIPPQSRGMYSNRMRSYKQEMGKLETDFKRSRIAYSDEVRNELLGDDGNSSENQRAHLLDNTERLERSSRRLEAGYQIAVETEQIGQEMLENLSHDREKIQRARERLRETDANLGKSSRVLTGMLRREEKKLSRNRETVMHNHTGEWQQLLKFGHFSFQSFCMHFCMYFVYVIEIIQHILYILLFALRVY
ncbi:vesicle transport through interaction with t-SNAREs homolog 1A isoform X2 [Equus przewalskii]|uniref:Vesicle transport through interaction with t-SNAREs 1A n=3 Tax=Equus TaxID=9789 RepID=A0A9L0TBH0_HORSE